MIEKIYGNENFKIDKFCEHLRPKIRAQIIWVVGSMLLLFFSLITCILDVFFFSLSFITCILNFFSPLFRHMWIHRKKVFTCEACSEVFEERELLDNHRLEKHPPSDATPYACTVCGKSFTSRQTLWEHGRVHGGTGSGATLLWCQQCK